MLVARWLIRPILKADASGWETKKCHSIFRIARCTDSHKCHGLTLAVALLTVLPVLEMSLLAAAPPHPNVLRCAFATDPTSLDVAFATVGEDVLLVYLLYQPLIDLNNGTNFFAHGAARWSASPDARAFTFHLRPEVHFSNGRPVVAADYAYGIQRFADPKISSPCQQYTAGIRGFADFTAGRTNRLAGLSSPTPYTLVVELEEPDPVFAYKIALYHGFAVPQEEVERRGVPFRKRPVGSGPYRLVAWQRGVQVVLEPNPCYAGPISNRFDRIEIMIGGDEATQLMMFERGELDIASTAGSGIPLSDLRRLERNSHWGPLIETMPGLNLIYISLNVDLPPLNDVRVRQALNYAVNKPRRLFTAARQFVPACGLFPPVMPGYDPSLKGYAFDPSKARRLLAETGLALPLRMTLWYPNEQLINRMIAEGIQADLRDVGIEIELRPVTGAALNALASTQGRAHIQMSCWMWNPLPDPSDIIATHFDSRAEARNMTSGWPIYSNQSVNQLIAEAAPINDIPRRFGLYQKAERIIVAEAPWLFLGHRNLFVLRQPWLKGPILEPTGFYRLDRTWIER